MRHSRQKYLSFFIARIFAGGFRYSQSFVTLSDVRRDLRRFAIFLKVFVLAGMMFALAGCSSMTGGLNAISNLSPFKKEEEILPGDRVAVLKPSSAKAGQDLLDTRTDVSLPPMTANASWSQPGGVENNAPGHLNYRGGGSNVWNRNVGYGSSSNGRLTAMPIVYQGRIFTLDTRATVSATSPGGGLVWQKNLTPANEGSKEGFGGGIAAGNGVIVVATGFGDVHALNPASGKKVWKASLGAPVRSSPSFGAGRVFVVTTEGKLVCLSAADGSEIWSQRGGLGRTRLLDNSSPAIEGRFVAAPYPSGDVVAYDIDSGGTITSESLSRSRKRSSLAAISNPARPVISGGVIYAVSHAGKMVATQIKTGKRLWTRNIRSRNMPWVVGNMVYVTDVHGTVHAMLKKTGKVKWQRKLPAEGGKWHGPVLAGQRLWLTSSNGVLAGVNALTGAVAVQKSYGQRTNLGPVIASGKLYVLTDKANLLAFN